MGNMSNPCINRYGINTFWHHFWYSDTFYSKNLQQDTLFLKLINTYIFFGLYLPKNIFWNKFWYLNNYKNSNYMQYFRWFSVKNETLGSLTSYRLRKTVNDVYPMKIWILKFNNWIIINFYWFQPWKKKVNLTQKLINNSYDNFIIESRKSYTNIKKLKLITSNYFLTKFTFKKQYRF